MDVVAGGEDLTNTIANLQVRSLAIAATKTINGQPFSIGEGGIKWTGIGNTAAVTINVPVTMLADQTWQMRELFLVFTADFSLNGHKLTFDGGFVTGGVTFDGTVTGHGTLTVNTGRIQLNNSNTYTGQTIVNGGELVAGHVNALGVGDGTIANGTLIDSGDLARLVVYGASLGNEWMRLTRTSIPVIFNLGFGGPAIVTGPVELNGNPILAFPGANGAALRFGGPAADLRRGNLRGAA